MTQRAIAAFITRTTQLKWVIGVAFVSSDVCCCPDPRYHDTWRWSLREVTRVRWGREGGAWREMSVFIRRHQRCPPNSISPTTISLTRNTQRVHVSTRWDGATYKSERQPSSEPNSLHLGPAGCRSVKIKFSLFKQPSVQYFVMAASAD